MRIKLSTVLWLLTLVAVFGAGLLAPSPFKPKQLRPVLVTTTKMDFMHQISSEDVTVEMWPADEIPDTVATHLNQVEYGWMRSQYPMGVPIDRNYVFFNIDGKGHYLGCRAIAINISNDLRNLRTDEVVFVKLDDEVILRSVRVAAIPRNNPPPNQTRPIAFWVPESQVDRLQDFDLKNTVFTMVDQLE